MGLNDEAGYVFDIQHFSIHDGPGIRTTVFLSGCSLRCRWCQNPESYHLRPRLSFCAEKCTKCMACLPACPEKAVSFENGVIRNNRELCTACGACIPVCPAEARSIIGREYTAEEVLKDVESDRVFYEGSGGGVTLSGGEVLFQPVFSTAVLKLCRENNLSTAVETTGNAAWQTVRDVLENTDLVLYDLKHMNSAEHKKGTGAGNERILENLKKIPKELNIPVIVRIPVIPGFNDSEENIRNSAGFILNELGPETPVNLLPYHRFGVGKWEQLEMSGPVFETEPPEDEAMQRLKEIFEKNNLNVQIGG